MIMRSDAIKYQKLFEEKKILNSFSRKVVVEKLLTTEDYLASRQIHKEVVKEVPCLSISSVSSALKSLENMGLLEKHRFQGNSTMYRLKKHRDIIRHERYISSTRELGRPF